jgi:hypothetical protein
MVSLQKEAYRRRRNGCKPNGSLIHHNALTERVDHWRATLHPFQTTLICQVNKLTYNPSFTIRWLRRLGWISMLFLLLLALGSLGWAWLVRTLGIIEWETQSVRLDSHSITLQHFKLVRQDASGASMDFRAGPIVFNWYDSSLTVGTINATVDAYPRADDTHKSSSPLRLDTLMAVPAWLPDRLSIPDFTVSLPCVQNHCTLEGSLSINQAKKQTLPLSLDVELRHAGHRLQGIALLEGTQEAPRLTANLAIDDKPLLLLRTAVTRHDQGNAWSGDLLVPAFSEAPWALAWLNEWWPISTLSAESLPETFRLQGNWQLDLPNTLTTYRDIAQATGAFQVDAHLPLAWPIPGVGAIKGDARLDVSLDKGYVLPRTVETTMQVDLRDQAWRQQLPSGTRPDTLHIKASTLHEKRNDALVPLDLDVTAQGEANLHLQGQLAFATASPWRARLKDIRTKATLAQWKQPEFSSSMLNANLTADGEITAHKADLTLTDINLGIERLTVSTGSDAVHLEQLGAQSSEAGLSVTWNGTHLAYTLKGNAQLRTQRIVHPQLKTTGWHWTGQVAATEQTRHLAGQLSTDTGLNLKTQLNHTTNKALVLDTTLGTVFMRAGNPLAQTLTAWPALLELNTGRLDGTVQLTLPMQDPLQARITLKSQGLGGIYDRVELSGLSGEATFETQGQHLTLAIPILQVDALNPGFDIGPLTLSGSYITTLDTPLAGTFTWQRLEASVLDGQVWVPSGHGNLGDYSLALPVQIKGLQVASLLKAYPTEGLSGEGTIDGQLPLHWTRQGIRIEQGNLSTRGPGVLRFRSARIKALGQSNPGMKLAADALDNFHYDVLRSGVDYREDGTLDLSLRLEGRNPSMNNGQPINFGISLEENIPQLLTSLQLTDRVSETIQRRVQERLQHDQSAPTTEEKP